MRYEMPGDETTPSSGVLPGGRPETKLMEWHMKYLGHRQLIEMCTRVGDVANALLNKVA